MASLSLLKGKVLTAAAPAVVPAVVPAVAPAVAPAPAPAPAVAPTVAPAVAPATVPDTSGITMTNVGAMKKALQIGITACEELRVTSDVESGCIEFAASNPLAWCKFNTGKQERKRDWKVTYDFDSHMYCITVKHGDIKIEVVVENLEDGLLRALSSMNKVQATVANL